MCGLSAGMASVLEVEDEPEEKDAFNSLHEHARLEELARRNTLCLPHLRSVYPIEVFSNDDDVTALSKDTSRSNVVEGHVNDFSRSSIVGGASRESSRSHVVESHAKEFSRSSITGGASRESSRSSVVEGHVKKFTRSSSTGGASRESSRSSIAVGHAGPSIVEGHLKESSRLKPSSTASLPPQSELSNRENIKRKVNIINIISHHHHHQLQYHW